MARAVGDKLYQALWLVQQFQDFLYDLKVSLLAATGDVIYLPGLTSLDNHIQSSAVVNYENPVSYVQAVAIDGYWLIFQGIGDC